MSYSLSERFDALTKHPSVTVLLSTLENPTNFGNFSQAVPFFQVTGEGTFCFPVDFAAAGISGVQNDANVTIQLEFDGGDGKLFQVWLSYKFVPRKPH